MSLKRREFLIQGAAAAAAPVVARAAAFSGPVIGTGMSEVLASARIIWSASAAPVPIQSGGAAQGIASSSNGQPNATAADFHCVFAKEVSLAATPSLAMLHLFTFTRYRLYVNGNYIGRGPCRYQNQPPEYDSRDIRSWLQPGPNLLVVLVHRDAPTGRIMHHDPGFVAALEIAHGGKRQVVATDASWLSMPELSFGPRAQAWSSIEEHIDARKITDWARPDLTLPIWQPSVVVSGRGEMRFFPRSAPLQLEKVRPWSSDSPALPIDLSSGDEIEFRLPEIAQAFHLLEMNAAEDSSLEVSYALPQGQASGRCTYAARSGVQTWMGGDTFAFDRLRLRVTAGHVRLTHAAAFEVRYPFERSASFACSDPFLGQLWNICARSLEILSEDAYVDCADRERVEWTDNSPPAFDCTRVMMRGPYEEVKAHWGDSRLLGALLRRIALTQQPDGQLKAHSCSERFDIHAIMEDRTCDWVVQLRAYLESSGDTELVRELWPVSARLLDWYRQRLTARGLVLAREWEVWDNPLRYQVCEGAGLNAMVHRAIVDASTLASRIGRQGDAQRLAQEAQRLQSDYNRLLWNEQESAYDGALFGPNSEIRSQSGHAFPGPIVDGRFRPTTQANLFALYGGIVPRERIPSVRKWVLNHLEEVREPMSHYYLFHMLYAMEDKQQDEAILGLMRTGWRNQVESEWHTTWEGLEKDGGSRVHIYGMNPGYFLTAFVLGARREGPVDQRTILIEPRFSGLDWAKGVCVTEFGPVEMEWKIGGTHRPEITCTVPGNVRATLRVSFVDASDVLEINGAVAPVRRANGWLEATLLSGTNRIRFRL
jgi:alpha-L-rhamnosidase